PLQQLSATVVGDIPVAIDAILRIPILFFAIPGVAAAADIPVVPDLRDETEIGAKIGTDVFIVPVQRIIARIMTIIQYIAGIPQNTAWHANLRLHVAVVLSAGMQRLHAQ